jgi:PASTA domain
MTDVETLLRKAMSEHSESLSLRPGLAPTALRAARRRTRINRVTSLAAAVVLVTGGIGAWAKIDDARRPAVVPVASEPVTPGRQVVVPDVLKGYLTDIQHRLCDAGLKPEIVSAPDINHGDTGLNGYGVIKSTPAAGSSVPRGSVVRLQLGFDVNAGGIEPSAPSVSEVPKVQGLDVDHALSALTSLGYLVDISVETPADGLQIQSQSPEPGVTLNRGATVTLIAGSAYGGACNPNL